MKKGLLAIISLLVVLVILLVLPMGTVLLASFTTTPVGVISDPTISNYVTVFSDPSYYQVVFNTFLLATGASTLAALIGVILAWIVARTNIPMKGALESMIYAPLIISPFVEGIAWTLLLSPEAGLLNVHLKNWFGFTLNIYSIWGMIWVIGLHSVPFIYLFASSSLRSMDPSLEEASFMLGAGNLRTTLRVTLPMSIPAIVAGWLMVFVIGLEMFSVPAVIGMPARIYVLATHIFSYMRFFPPQYGLATVSGVILLMITMIGVYMQRRIVIKRQYYAVTGKGYRPREIQLGPITKYFLLTLCSFYAILVVILPIGALVLTSFLPYFSPDFTWSSLTLRNYAFVFTFPQTITAIRNTLFLSCISALIGILLALAITYIVYRTQIRGRLILDYLSTMPIGMPAIVLALGMLWFWVAMPESIYGTIWVLLFAYLIRFLPWGTRSTMSALVQVHPELEECSTVLGASTLYTLRRIVMPLIKYGLLGGFITLFTLSAKEISASILLYTPKTIVIAISIFEFYENAMYPPMAALTMIAVVIVLIPLIIFRRLVGRVTMD